VQWPLISLSFWDTPQPAHIPVPRDHSHLLLSSLPCPESILLTQFIQPYTAELIRASVQLPSLKLGTSYKHLCWRLGGLLLPLPAWYCHMCASVVDWVGPEEGGLFREQSQRQEDGPKNSWGRAVCFLWFRMSSARLVLTVHLLHSRHKRLEVCAMCSSENRVVTCPRPGHSK
jgi:hypothetical protein